MPVQAIAVLIEKLSYNLTWRVMKLTWKERTESGEQFGYFQLEKVEGMIRF